MLIPILVGNIFIFFFKLFHYTNFYLYFTVLTEQKLNTGKKYRNSFFFTKLEGTTVGNWRTLFDQETAFLLYNILTVSFSQKVRLRTVSWSNVKSKQTSSQVLCYGWKANLLFTLLYETVHTFYKISRHCQVRKRHNIFINQVFFKNIPHKLRFC
jgi:hypothetical protein